MLAHTYEPSTRETEAGGSQVYELGYIPNVFKTKITFFFETRSYYAALAGLELAI